tara:strand:- start:38 stop:322 length:285 start_codon:yes stop_codon:yes gene_type:complete
MGQLEKLKKLILNKLIRANVWGGKHIPLYYVRNGIPENYRNSNQGKKEMERAIKEMVNEGWIVIQKKATGGGIDGHVSLNQKKVREIKGFLEKN